MTINNYSDEIDCPWFDPDWLVEHPEFPLARPRATATNSSTSDKSFDPINSRLWETN